MRLAQVAGGSSAWAGPGPPSGDRGDDGQVLAQAALAAGTPVVPRAPGSLATATPRVPSRDAGGSGRAGPVLSSS